MDKFNRGSEWRKWDLHVHTPYSSGYSGTWGEFQTQIKDADCSAIGINDYFSVEGYKKLTFDIQNGDLDVGDKVFFPVVEMRMSESVQNKHAGNGATHFNFHLIFNNEEEILKLDDIESFIKSLKSNGSIIGSDYNDKEKRSQMKVSLNDVLNELNSDKKFKDNFLLWIPYDEYGGIDEINPDSDSWIKENYIRKANILGSSREKQIDFFLWKSDLKADGTPKFTEEQFKAWFEDKKPCIKGSDSHASDYPIGKLKDYKSKPMEKFCWIKADLTFDGLKQIVYEPEYRIKLHGRKPEEKSSYQVIDHITINSPDIYNQQIEFNKNLNSIIGGRSTGKSVLLAAIAKKLKSDRPIWFSEYKREYEIFVSSISKSIEIHWADGQVNDDREIEFFEQGYMYELARNSKKLDQLVQNILSQRGADEILQGFSGKKASIKKEISSLISDIFQAIESLNDKEIKIKELGDKKGVHDEITKLVSEQEKLNDQSISAEEKQAYEKCKSDIELYTENKRISELDKIKLAQIQSMSLIRSDFEFEMTEMSNKSKEQVVAILNNIKEETNSKWNQSIDTIKQKIDDDISVLDKKNISLQEDSSFIKVSKVYENSTQLAEIEKNIELQKSKIIIIERLEKEAEDLESQKKQLKVKILSLHKSYYLEVTELLPKLSNKQDTLHIIAKSSFSTEDYRDLLTNAINLQSSTNQNLSIFQYDDNDTYMQHIEKVFDHLVQKRILLKGGYTHSRLAGLILTACFYDISYDLAYEDDNFHQMSDGKKAFVILKLLLEFSEKSCPILIDQPEDDLDNRAIFLDLVQYIKIKKIERQIILATHNPNIVVGADSECVIVANQNGLKSENQDNKKFEYKTGSLENTAELNNSCKYVLESQGIREHVCVILEGGDTAFKLRERKYNIH